MEPASSMQIPAAAGPSPSIDRVLLSKHDHVLWSKGSTRPLTAEATMKQAATANRSSRAASAASPARHLRPGAGHSSSSNASGSGKRNAVRSPRSPIRSSKAEEGAADVDQQQQQQHELSAALGKLASSLTGGSTRRGASDWRTPSKASPRPATSAARSQQLPPHTPIGRGTARAVRPPSPKHATAHAGGPSPRRQWQRTRPHTSGSAGTTGRRTAAAALHASLTAGAGGQAHGQGAPALGVWPAGPVLSRAALVKEQQRADRGSGWAVSSTMAASPATTTRPHTAHAGTGGHDVSALPELATAKRSSSRAAGAAGDPQMTATIQASHVKDTLTSTAPRPVFLKQLEEFIADELATIHAPNDAQPNTARLQVFREAFTFFIEDFRTYTPLLAAIKAEYEGMLERYAQQLHELPGLKTQLHTLRLETRQMLGRAYRQHKTAMDKLQAQLDEARARIAELEQANHDAKADVYNLNKKVKELEVNNENSRKSNKMLVLAVRRAEDSLRTVRQHETQMEAELLQSRQQLHKAMEHAEDSLQRLAELKNQVKGMVPKSEAEEQAEELASTRAELEELRTNYASLSSEHTATQHALQQLETRRDAIEAERERLNRLRQAAMSRPPPKWMRRLATKLDISGRWRREKRANGDERMQYEEGFDPDELLSQLLQAVQKLKNKVKQGEVQVETLNARVGFLMAQHAASNRPASEAASPATPVQEKAEPKSPATPAAWPQSTMSSTTPEHPTFGLASPTPTADVSVHNWLHTSGSQVNAPTTQTPSHTGDALFTSGVRLRPFAARAQYFHGLGTDTMVPRYLRVFGRIRNRMLTKAQTERLVKECWMAKQTLGQRVPLASFFHLFLKRQFPEPGAAIEMAYNVVDSLRRHQYDSDLSVFLKVLEGELPEALQQQEVLMLQRILAHCVSLDRKNNGGSLSRRLPRAAFEKLLREQFPCKRIANLNRLMKSLDSEQELHAVDGSIMYEGLFTEDDQGDQGPFCEQLRAQHLQEFMEYSKELTHAITHAVPLAAPGREQQITVATARETIKATDPDKPDADIEALVSRGFGRPAEALQDPEERVPLSTFLSLLRDGWLERSTKPREGMRKLRRNAVLAVGLATALRA